MKRIIIQYGGTGDLAEKKLYPAYRNLMERGYEFELLALGRRFAGREEFLSSLLEADVPTSFTDHLHYLFHDMDHRDAVDRLSSTIKELVGEADEAEFIYYLALQPSLYEGAIAQIKEIDRVLACACALTKKIIVEKPFGFDLESAKRYNAILEQAFSDEEIYRVDHYLGKEFMQNLLLMRFHNDIIRRIWDNQSIESIQIIFDERHGVDQRLGFYEKIGVVRDTIQNHILQIVAHLTMGEPASISFEDIAIEKQKVLCSISPIEHFSLGRYESLGADTGRVVETPTYAAFTLFVNSYYFAGIPIHVRTGKMQAEAKSLIYIKFKNITRDVMSDDSIKENAVIITIDPELTIDFSVNIKVPNTSWKSQPVRFRFNQSETFSVNSPEAYEQIVEKILQGDKSLFPTIPEICESWRIVEPMLKEDLPVEVYPVRTLPRFVDAMARENNFTWFA